MEHQVTAGSEADRLELSRLLRLCRTRISPDVVAFGAVLRHPSRIGKLVTQAEVAEVAGISRQWYAALEGARPVRVSSQVLTRLADALDMDELERRTIFALAIPEMKVALSPSSSVVLHEFEALRFIMRRVWTASSAVEILSAVLEYCKGRFKEADLVISLLRVAPGFFASPVTIAEEQTARRLEELYQTIGAQLTPEEVDDAMLHRALPLAGQTGISTNLYRSEAVAERTLRQLQQAGFDNNVVLCARVRSSDAYRPMIGITRTFGGPYEFDDSDFAVVGALADLASLALTNTPLPDRNT